MISTKGRYALRFMIDLAEQQQGRFVPLKDISARQEISVKYLQHICKSLVDAGILLGVSGKGGGYRLAAPADEISVLSVLEVAEGSLAPVACLMKDAPKCSRVEECKTLPLWSRYYALERDFFAGVSVADLADGTFQETDLGCLPASPESLCP